MTNAQKNIFKGEFYVQNSHFRPAVSKLRGPWNKKFGKGKNMIFPASSHGGGGYTASQITALKKALAPLNNCN